MDFYDLNLQEPKLAGEEKALGFAGSRTAKIILLREGRDINSANSRELISVESNDPELLRNCIKQRKPALCNPLPTANFYRDEGLMREAAERGTSFEIPLSELLKTNFVYRAKLINNVGIFLRKCLKLGAPFAFTSRAKSIYELKSPREMVAISSSIFGLTREQAEYAISMRPEKLLKGTG